MDTVWCVQLCKDKYRLFIRGLPSPEENRDRLEMVLGCWLPGVVGEGGIQFTFELKEYVIYNIYK